MSGGAAPARENVPGIVGLGAAARLALQRLPEMGGRVALLRDRLEQRDQGAGSPTCGPTARRSIACPT